jgi:WD40 repeat protein
LIDVRSGDVISVLSRDGEWLSQAHFSPDGRFIVAGMQGERAPREQQHEYLVRDGHSGALMHRLEGTGYWQGSIAFSADGAKVLCAGITPNADAGVWDVATGKLLQKLGAHMTTLAALSPDGKRALSIDGSGYGSLWNAETGERIRTIDDLGRPMMEGGFSDDGKLCFILGYEKASVQLFDGVTGERKNVSDKWKGPFQHAFLVESGRTLFTSDKARRMQWWDTSSGECRRTVEGGANDEWSVVHTSSDGRFIVCSSPKMATRMIDGTSGAELWTVPGSAAWFRGFGFSRDDETIAIGVEGTRVELRRSRDGKLLSALTSPSMDITAVSASPDGGSMATACSDGTVRIVDLESGRARVLRGASEGPASVMEWNARRNLIAIMTRDGAVDVVDPSSGASNGPSRTLTRVAIDPKSYARFSASFDPSGKTLLVRAKNAGVMLVDVDSGSLARLGEADHDAVESAWSADGSRIAIATAKGDVEVWDASTQTLVGSKIAVGHRVEALAFDPKGERLAVGTDDAMAHVFDLAKRAEIHQLSHKDQDIFGDLTVAQIVYRPDGRQVLSTTHDFGEVRAWDPETGKKLWSFDFGGGNGATLRALYAFGGDRIVTSGQTWGTTRVSDAKDGHAIADLSQRRINSLLPTAGDRRLLGVSAGSIQVVDAASFRTLYTRIEFDHGDALLEAPSLHCDGAIEPLRRAHVLANGESAPLECYASELFDPKKVRASAHGIEVARARLPSLPSIRLVSPTARVVRATGASTTVECAARDASGIAGFEVERDGRRIDAPFEIDANDSINAVCKLAIPKPASGRPVELRISAVARSGAVSRPVLIAIESAD